MGLSRPVELSGEAPPHKVVWITPMPGEETASGNGPEPLAPTMPCGGPPAVGWDGVSCESPGGTPTGSVSGGGSDVVSSGPVAGSDPEESPPPSVGAESGGVVSGSGGGVVVSESGGGVTWGFGAQYFLWRGLAARLEGQRYMKVGGGDIGDSDYNVYTIGLLYKM